MRIRLVQCLCGPARHAILALAVKPPPAEMPDARALDLLRTAVEALQEGRGTELGLPFRAIDPWCGLCGAAASGWTHEIGWSRSFADWEAAEAALRQCEAEQQASRGLLDLLDATYTARLRRAVDDAHAGHEDGG